MRLLICVAATLVFAAATAAQPTPPPGCTKHPSAPGCAKTIPPPTSTSSTVTLAPSVTNNTAITTITNLTPPTLQRAPVGKIRVEAKIVAIRTKRNGNKAIYAQLWNRALRSRPIGYSLTTCSPVSGGGVFELMGIQECHAYYAMPRGKIVAYGLMFAPRNYWLVITGGTRIYMHGAGWAHYSHGRLTITFPTSTR